MSWLSLILSLLAFGCFGLATDNHHHRLSRRRLSPAAKTRWRAGAWVALALAFAMAIVARGWVFGPVLWLGVVMLAAGVVFLVLNLRLQRLRDTNQKRW